MKNLTYIDLFAGAGGLSEGFVSEGFTPVAHVEIDKEACDTLKTRLAFHHLKNSKDVEYYLEYLKNKIDRKTLWDKVPQELISSVLNEEISARTVDSLFRGIDQQILNGKVDVIIGGPPCQAYSVVGRSRDPKGMKWDKRNFLFRHYAQFLKRYQPKFFVFENVLGLLTAGNSKYLNEMLELFTAIGYSADMKILNAEDYGVLQKRRRVIIIGRRGSRKFTFPEIEASTYSGEVKRDLFSDLLRLAPGEELNVSTYPKAATNYLKLSSIRNGVNFVTQHITRSHNQRDLEIYFIAIEKWLNERRRLNYSELPARLRTHNNTEAFLDRYKVVDPNGLSHTVVAHISKDGHYYIYPDPGQVRSISVREAARIQSFPDDYFFEGGRTAAFKQIGNAVPPLMATVIARAIKKFL
jgi:DNA (cytosine-5)-methyltransferase 1